MNYYVYRFLNQQHQVVYVGRTTKIMSRMNTHFSGSGHLSPECYEQVVRVDYLELKSNSDMKIKELYYLSKYKPAFNSMDVDDVSFPFNELDDIWVTFDLKRERKYLREYDALLQQVEQLELEKGSVIREKEALEMKVQSLENRTMRLSRKHITEHVFKTEGTESTDVSYESAKQALLNDPELVFVNLVEGNVRLSLFSYDGEILGRLHNHSDFKEAPEPESYYTVVLYPERGYEKPKLLNNFPDDHGLKTLGLETELRLCNNWTVSKNPTSMTKEDSGLTSV